MTAEELEKLRAGARERAAQRERWRKLDERRKTIVADLRARIGANPTPLEAEAADVIEHLNERIRQADIDLREESRYAQRAAQDAYSEGRHEGRREGRGEW